MAAVVTKVWQSNLEKEFIKIQQYMSGFTIISIDIEFPGTVYNLNIPKYDYSRLSPVQHYSLMKQNVDALKIIQLGLTLTDSRSNIAGVWEFNFSDFDVDSDLSNPDSIDLLRRQGINFSDNKRLGIDSQVFARSLKMSGLILQRPMSMDREWVVFHGLYDLGFLIKILTGRPLPHDLQDFMMLLRYYFRPQIYDLKPIARSLGLCGGLEKIAEALSVERFVGKSHQAGSDSLLIFHIFIRLAIKINSCNGSWFRFNYMLHGLTRNYLN